MALRKIIMDNATVLARDHAAIFAGALADGRLKGAAVSFANNTVTVGVGYLIACGREVYNDSTETVAIPGSSGVGQVIMTINVSGDGSVSLAARTAESEGALPPLVQDDINDGTSTTYEMEIALVDLSSGTLIRSAPLAARPIYVVDAAPTAGARDGVYLVRRAGA